MERVVLHSDINNFYASVECLYRPNLRELPVAVTGDPERRHGIILAKNNLAKAHGVKTGEPLWKARQKCPDIVFVKPDYKKYMRFSAMAREIYSEYTNCVEPFGADECWLDLTGTKHTKGNAYAGGKAVADEIRYRIREELGITASIGVSFNKLFAKLASDMKKPNATTLIAPDDFREKVWSQPAGDMLFIGRATAKRLEKFGIKTIGDIANSELDFLKAMFGKNGVTMWGFANGLDASPVATSDAHPLMKSIGNGTTAPRDLITDEDIRITLHILCESVSARLREKDLTCRTVQLGVRNSDLKSYERQAPLNPPSRTEKNLFDKAYWLFKKHHTAGIPVRSLSVRACGLQKPYGQLSLNGLRSEVERQEALDSAIDSLRNKFGSTAVRRGITLMDPLISDFNPQGATIMLPEAFIKN